MSVRFDLIDQEIDWAETEEAKGEMSAWDQEVWAVDDAPCGTAYCIAGHVAAGAGWRPTVRLYLSGSQELDYVNLINDDGEEWEVDAISSEILGIETTWNYADDLFRSDNTLEDLKRIRDNFAESEGVPTKWR